MNEDLKLPLTIGMLSWQQHKTLISTLGSYKESGLLNLAAQFFIFFQEISRDDIDIAQAYGLTFQGSGNNLGIAGGYREMLKYIEQPYYLFLENDWKSTGIPAWYQIKDGIELLKDGKADVVRYRSRTDPGHPLWSRQFEGNELARPEHLMDSIHWTEHPDLQFPNQINRLDTSRDWYQTTAQYANWTNNPHMVRTDWLKKYLLPRLGDNDIEKDLQGWWQEQNYLVAQGNGLFTHWRIG